MVDSVLVLFDMPAMSHVSHHFRLDAMFVAGGGQQLRRRYGSDSEPAQDSFVIQKTDDNGYLGSTTSTATAMASTSLNSSRDRTAEFLSAVRSFQGRQINGQLPSAPSSSPSARKAQVSQRNLTAHVQAWPALTHCFRWRVRRRSS